jgi:hypothetical protein
MKRSWSVREWLPNAATLTLLSVTMNAQGVVVVEDAVAGPPAARPAQRSDPYSASRRRRPPPPPGRLHFLTQLPLLLAHPVTHRLVLRRIGFDRAPVDRHATDLRRAQFARQMAAI